MATSPLMKVSFLGLGSMGNAMAKNILNKGFQLTVWNRTSSKANDLKNAGAHLAVNLREAVTDADVIISCLFDDKSCLEAAQGENGYLMGIQKNAIHVNTTTINPNVATQLEELHKQHGAFYIAGPVFGRPDVASSGKLRSFLGGNHDAIERARAVIETYSGGAMIIVGDSPAQANVIKLTGNMILAANISLFGQIYAFNERWGIDHNITHQILGTFYSHPSLLAYEGRVRDRNYERPSGEGFGVEGGLKDINTMLNAGDQVGVPLPFCSVMREHMVSAMGNGLKDMDWSVLGDVARLNAGLPLESQEKK
ncbi:unnamed protein product [Rotaria magnacalcarata]|uniref:6-phosphogluconate dehydrogenase NADP-binding domain-containing protein n=2 Tax=Rotaria magnacalcarata TaxID=392030 RepID=A0A816Y6G7_9BILA|nr:unnamed protein product [Rotaria magnacalcarata]CAF1463234.1 unnamed protein product [Rotaria magnacalcarata]CAF2101657.1 unnamed protein product [Rotaria magnacalcarata]CAF2155415.1 unnamed protein product [Rotaria magnacalcarata]CAF3803690.1 unnamed protein product [Rotaria magnacalcarata]